MPYIGNPIYQSAFVTDQFSGTGSQTAYTMSVAPAGVSNVLVAVSGVLQDPSTYGVVGNTLNFTTAPPSGTGNISCRYLGVPATGVVTTAYRTVTEFTATAGQTTFTPPSYNVGFINVYRNGVLLGSADYTATNGTTVVLASGASAGNLVTVESFQISSVANAIPNAAGAVSSSNIVSGVTLTNPTVTGTLGINVSSPGSRLQIGDATVSTSNGIIFGKYGASTETNLPAIRQGSYSGVGNDLVMGSTSTSGVVRFYTGAAASSLDFGSNVNLERMRIDASGYITMPYQPVFSGGCSQGSNLVSPSLIPYGDITFINTGSCWNSSTNRFTAPIAGNYLIAMSARPGGATGTITVNLQKNGSVIYYLQNSTASGYTPTGAHTVIWTLAAGDYVNFQISGGSLGAGQDIGTLSIRLV